MNKREKKVLALCMLWTLALALVVGCAAHKPLNKGKVAQDLFIRTLEVTATNMPTLEKQFPTKVHEIKKVFMQLKKGVQLYQDALRFWETTGEKPVNYDTLILELFKSVNDLRPFLTSIGVKL